MQRRYVRFFGRTTIRTAAHKKNPLFQLSTFNETVFMPILDLLGNLLQRRLKSHSNVESSKWEFWALLMFSAVNNNNQYCTLCRLIYLKSVFLHRYD